MKQRASVKQVLSMFIALALITGLPAIGFGDVPQQINYQGVLADNAGAPLDGTYSMTFAIYDAATLGTLAWSETQGSVTVTNGTVTASDLGANSVGASEMRDNAIGSSEIVDDSVRETGCYRPRCICHTERW